jgi:hypothetical protein
MIDNMMFSKEQENDKKEKCCSYCHENNHNILKCEKMNNELNELTNYCSQYENQINIPKTKEFLEKLNNAVIKRYVKKHNLKRYMYNNCSQYYDNSVKNDIDIIIGYLCVLPLHPEIKIKRTTYKKEKYTKVKPNRHRQHNNYGIFFGTNGIHIGFGLVL